MLSSLSKAAVIDKAEDRELFKQVWLTAPALLENTISGGAPCKAWYDTRMSYAKNFLSHYVHNGLCKLRCLLLAKAAAAPA